MKRLDASTLERMAAVAHADMTIYNEIKEVFLLKVDAYESKYNTKLFC